MNINSNTLKSRWLGLIPIGFTFALMVWFSWRKWPELLIDFGRQLYVPWRLSEGDVFFRDVAYLPGGPFSQYFNALLFKIFGVSYTTLFMTDLVLAVVMITYIYFLFVRSCDRRAATMIGLAVVIGFALPQYFEQGSYNYISPYVHEVMHGLYLNILLIGALSTWLENGSKKMLFAGGLCFGLIFLTKPETFLAALGVCFACFLVVMKNAESRKNVWKQLPLFLLAGLVMPFLFFLYFLKHCPVGESIRYTCWAWVPLLTSDVTDNNFYRWCLGLDLPKLRAKASLMQFLQAGSIMAVLWCRCRAKRSFPAEKWLWAAVACAIAYSYDWTKTGRSIPIFSVFALAVFLWHHWNKDWRQRTFSVPFFWIVFSLFFLAKMGLNSRLYHYGFALAMPAFISSVFLAVWLLPEILQRLSGRGDVFRFVMVVFVVTGLFGLAEESLRFYQKKTFLVGSGADRFYADPLDLETKDMAEAAVWLKREIPAGKTIAAIPEGAMLNYLSRHPNSTPYIAFGAEVQAFGDDVMFAAFQKSPPDFVMLVHCTSGEYGPRFYGGQKGFGMDLMEWIKANYKPFHLIGHEPLQSDRFGIRILKRASGNENPVAVTR